MLLALDFEVGTNILKTVLVPFLNDFNTCSSCGNKNSFKMVSIKGNR
jgi:hypothetical protein